MKKMLVTIENAICEEYAEIRKREKIINGIDDVHKQIRFSNPELAEHVKKRFLALAKKNGDLP